MDDAREGLPRSISFGGLAVDERAAEARIEDGALRVVDQWGQSIPGRPVAFRLDLHSGEIDSGFPTEANRECLDRLQREIDGELLDYLYAQCLGRLEIDPLVVDVETALEAWVHRIFVSTLEVFPHARTDEFFMDGRTFSCLDNYFTRPVVPGVLEALLFFGATGEGGANRSPGAAVLRIDGGDGWHRDDLLEVDEREPGSRGLIQILVRQFQRRHPDPDYLRRRRSELFVSMEHYVAAFEYWRGEVDTPRRAHPHIDPRNGVGPNQACPCGSRQQYQDCCAAGRFEDHA